MAKDTKFIKRKFKSVGTRPPRPDGLDKVTGRARYGADMFAPGQLVGMVLRSPHAHAEIKRLEDEWVSQEYARNRKAEYDALNQLEMQFDDKEDGTTTWEDAIKAIKTKWPKDNSGPV